jgi:DNA-binding XRE family transcriptional regulator
MKTNVPRLAAMRAEWELDQAGLATILGTTRETISRWERGAATPDIPTLLRLAKLFGVSVSYLIGETDVRPRRARASSPSS